MVYFSSFQRLEYAFTEGFFMENTSIYYISIKFLLLFYSFSRIKCFFSYASVHLEHLYRLVLHIKKAGLVFFAKPAFLQYN